MSYDTEPAWDFVFVEAHTVGQDDWTTLPDANGHTSDDPGDSCPEGWRELHPFIDHYQTLDAADGSCTNTGSSGAWNAASGNSGGFGEWDVDLSSFAGKNVEVAISYVQDWATGGLGAFLDDVSITKDGTAIAETSFESDDGGWAVGAPDGSSHEATWQRRASVGFTEGPGVATADTLYYAFGLEGVTGAASRAELMTNAMRYLGVTTSGGGSGGGGGGGGAGTQTPPGGGGSPPADVGGEAQSGAGGQNAIGGAKAPARVSFARQTLRVPKGRHYVRVKLACPVSTGTSTRCRGVLRMLLGGTLLARRAFSIPADTPATVRLQLRDRDYRRLRARGRMKVSGIVLTRGADGRQRRVAATITLLPS